MFGLFEQRGLTPLARAYHSGTQRRVDRKRLWDDLTFVVLDAETTGFTVGRDRMLALAWMEVRAGRMALDRSVNLLVRQPQAPVNAAVAVHGILPHDTAGGLDEAAVLNELLPRITGSIIVGHHIRFDAAVLDEALRRHHGLRLRNPLLDTAQMAMSSIDAFRKTGYANQRPPTLDELCAHTGLPVVGRHTAAGDAFTTAQLFLLLSGRQRRRLGRPLRAGDLPLGRL